MEQKVRKRKRQCVMVAQNQGSQTGMLKKAQALI
jgi:hypothetical protein